MEGGVFVVLGVFAFCGGLIDAAVGGGGLVQVPALMQALPSSPLASVFGTNKLAVLLGNLCSIPGYLKRVKIDWRLLLPMVGVAFVFSFLGALSVSQVPRHLMEPAVLAMLVLMAIYTFRNKDFGQRHVARSHTRKFIMMGIFAAAAVGFYDGLFGPGSGSLLLFMFVRSFGFDFLHASASAKVINLGTFSAALLFFVPSGHVLWGLGLMVGVCNIAGAITGVHLSLRYGSGFIRILFLILLVLLIGRLAWSMAA